MMAVILAGGKGTRLRPFTMTLPKPLLPVGDVAILEVVLSQLQAAGIKRIVVTLGHMAHLFAASIGDGTRLGLKVEYFMEDSPLGTAGSLKRIPGLEDDFLVMNGDLLTTLDFNALCCFHSTQRAWATLAVHARTVQIDYGVIESSSDGFLKSYTEKPVIPYQVSMGINVVSRRCLEFIPADRKFDMPELMMALQAAGHPISCYRTDCYWQDIGRFEDYQQASADFTADPSRFFKSSSSDR